MAEYLCFGDYICLYCEDTKGYMYSEQSSSTMDGLFVYTAQDREQPKGVPNIHAMTFQVYSMNRYKLSKKYRTMVNKYGPNPEDEELNKQMQELKSVSDVEAADNTAEQIRLRGKRLRYGDTVQLQHVFTNKFVHISTDCTSVVDKSKMMVTLQTFSSKNAQFKIMPRYRIKVEGENIEMNDQICLESTKSPGNFLHASKPYQIDSFTRGSELNAGVDKASFTVLFHFRHTPEMQVFFKGGDVVRLFHKDIEAYLVAEGGFRQPPMEDVHLRIRESNPNDPRTLYQPKSGITYWQLELASSILDGQVVRWEQSIRFRHMPTRRYLALSENHEIYLSDDGLDPMTVFKLNSLSQKPDTNLVRLDSNGRIEHVVTGCWLHAPIDEPYEKKHRQSGGDTDLRWDGADLLKVRASPSRQYQDAFTLQKVQEKEWRNFNYVAGIVPFIEDLIVKRQDPQFTIQSRQKVSIIQTLRDLKNFIHAEGERTKDRQKLLRNLSVIDVMKRLLETPLSDDRPDKAHLYEVFREFYQVLHAYTEGNSRKNALYAATYIPFFMKQLPVKGNVGLECCKMMIDLIRDNRRIVDRISPEDLLAIIKLFRERQHFLYLDLLGVLSVCDGIAMTENQTLIAEQLLGTQKDCLYHLELGQDVALTKDIIYVSMDNRKTWVPLHTMSYKSNPDYDEMRYLFLTHQLELYKQLCYGRNQTAINIITRNREYFTWEVAYLGVMTELLPFAMRAKFCNLLIGLFIDIGDNYSIISVTSNNFVYGEIDIQNYGQGSADGVPHDFDSHFPSMRVWIGEFFKANGQLIASQPGRNVLIKEVLRMVTTLIRYGFMGSKTEMDAIMKPVFNLIDGTKDIPFAPGKGTEFTREQQGIVREWRKSERFFKNIETEAIIQAKIQGLEMIEILLIKEFNRRVRYFVSTFKKIELYEAKSKSKRKALGRLLYDEFDSKKLWHDKVIREKIDKFLGHMYSITELLHPSLPGILFDLTKYPSDELNTKSLAILNKFYASKLQLFHTTQRSHALLSMESVRVHREALQSMVLLTRLSKSKLTADMAKEVVRILYSFAKLCYVAHTPSEPHPIGQNILVNNGLLNILLPLVTQEVDKNLKDRFAISQAVIGAALEVLRFLAMKNAFVQSYLMNQLDALISVQCCGEQQALTLLEVFRDHTVHCLRLQPHHVQKLVRLAGQYREKAPGFLSLLKVIMKMEISGTLLKRNQHLVTKYIMENYKSAAYVMGLSQTRRLRILIGKEGPEHQRYCIDLIELLATCAEGENRYIESLCQTLVSPTELVSVLNNRNIAMSTKAGFARYFIWAYLRTARNAIESGVDELPHSPGIWKHIKILYTMMSKANMETSKAKQAAREEMAMKRAETSKPSVLVGLMSVSKSVAKAPMLAALSKADEFESIVMYMVKAGFLLLQTFFSRFYQEDRETYPEEHETLKKLASATLKFVEFAGEFATTNDELTVMIECIEALAFSVRISKSALEKICNETNLKGIVKNIRTRVAEKHMKRVEEKAKMVSTEEMDLNSKMHNFGDNLATYLENQNTLSAQLKIRGRKRGLIPYISDDLEVKFPLGNEFQIHVKSFTQGTPPHQRIHSMIDHLEIAAKNIKNTNFVPEEELDIRCLQILRSLIYNKYVTLPDNWNNDPKRHKKTVDEIVALQDAYLDYDIVRKIMPLLDRRVTVAMEVLSLIDLLLFNSNKRMQEVLIKYFTSTVEEIFFIFVRVRLLVANTALKERRSIKAQLEARKRDMKKKRRDKGEDDDDPNQKTKAVKINKKALRRKGLKPFFRRMNMNRLLINEEKKDEEFEEKKRRQDMEIDLGLVNPAYEDEVEDEDEVTNVGEYQDGSDVCLVFRVLARFCDGQYAKLQDYLRDQPDNLRKVNLVAEVTIFFGSLYTHITSETIDLASQVICAIQEISMGNQENRAVVLNNKIIDYSNFLLRIIKFENCTVEQVVQLKMELVVLISGLTEENGPGPTQIAKEIRDTLDIGAIKRHIYLAYSVVVEGKMNVEKLILGVEQTGNKKNKLTKELKEIINDMGFRFYFILARLFDLDPKLEKQGFDNSAEKMAFRHYKAQCMSVEVVKDNHLQKVHFRVRNPDLLREEVKEEVRWNIDRTSPSNKLRDLLTWTKDVLKDIEYQKKILKNPIIKQLAKRWAIWNYACIILSLVINVIMLATWEAPLLPLEANQTVADPDLRSLRPLIEWEYFDITSNILCAVHNFSSFMLFISYLLLKHPRMPSLSFFKKFSRCLKKEKEEDISTTVDVEEEPQSRLQPSLLSTTTIYYLLLMALSFAGTFFYGYFFAFHLINIIANNELLKGVVKAVTQNGRSLLWVGIMGVIIIYIYALLAFAFFRGSFNPEDELYCDSLMQCFVSVLRYGVIGDISDSIKLDPAAETFTNFIFLTLYQLTFFILFTTIGLNVIFGIIVDTFSELRDLKWTAEKDMRDTCFICSRDSYDFEHEGKGFAHHVAYEHDTWAYVFYFLHLRETSDNDCGAIDLYVLRKVRHDVLDFFPLNRALCLTPDEEDETDTKLDEVVATLDTIEQRQSKEEEVRRQEAERRRQVAWQDQFRLAQGQRSPTVNASDTVDLDSNMDESVA